MLVLELSDAIMAKKPAPARAKRKGEIVPLRTMRLAAGRQVAPVAYDQPQQLKALREKLRAEDSAKNDAARANRDRIEMTLEKIRSKFGEEVYRAAVKDFQYHGYPIVKASMTADH